MIPPVTAPITAPKVTPIPSFQAKYKIKGGNPDLKQLWDRGKLPTVKYGFYGDELTSENISREHLKPASLGGTKRFGNIVLASKANNQRRGNKEIGLFATLENARIYLSQFIDVKLPEFNGNRYIKAVTETLKDLGWIK